jgi:hypothetical protein
MSMRRLISRWVPYVLMLLVVFSAATGTTRASLNPVLIAAAAPLLEPEAEHKALPAAAHLQRRNQPIGERRIRTFGRHATPRGTTAAIAPSRTGHLAQPRAPPTFC